MAIQYNFEEVVKNTRPITINLNKNLDDLPKDILFIRNIFKSNIEEVLNNYGNVFTIDIKRLVKDTAYKVNSKDELIALINEDLILIDFKQIITSRLCVVFYRLTYFDLDASKASIGRFFANHFEKSESFKINLNRNSYGLFFTDLSNKIFRGYRIKPLKFEIPDSIFDLKIKIAKNLLRNDVKIKIVAESLEISEEELKDAIYNETKALSSPYYPYKL